MKTRSDVLN